MTRAISKGVRFSYYLMIFGFGCGFWIASMTRYFEMRHNVYGVLADRPEYMLAGAMLFPATAYLIALFINGRRSWTAPLRCIAGFWMVLYFAGFMLSSYDAPDGAAMAITSSVLSFKALWMLAYDWQDVRRR